MINELNLKENIDLKKLNTMGLGGKCKYYFTPTTKEELLNGINIIEKENIKWFILGGGSNVILPDNDFNGVIISLKNMRTIKLEKDTMFAHAGVSLSYTNNLLLKKGYTNFVWSAGIPGTLGGAIFGNAGCYGKTIFSDLISVTVLKDKEFIVLPKDDIKYSYRETNLKDVIIIGALFNIEKKDYTKSLNDMKDWAIKRFETQPLKYKNAGSTFRNPENDSAGRLIEAAGLKGLKVGGASVSEKHANFIVNLNDATSNDVVTLIYKIQSEIKRIYNIDLIIENKIIKWEEL